MYSKLKLDKYFSRWLILMIDLFFSVGSTIVAYILISFFFEVPLRPGNLIALIGISMATSLVAFYLFKTYCSIIRHASLREIWKIGAAVLFKELWMAIVFFKLWPILDFHLLWIGMILDMLITVSTLIALRVLMIIAYDVIKGNYFQKKKHMRILVYGVDAKAVALVTRLQNSPHYDIRGFITYGKRLKSYEITEHPVLYFENEDNVRYLAARYDIDAVLFATYDSAREEQNRLIDFCASKGIKILMAPPIDEVIDGKLMKQSIREINIEDLLERPEIKISMEGIIRNFQDKTILVTGAAGSIGSELCRQLASFGIKKLVMFDCAETPMHNIRLELEERFPELKFIPVIGDVRLSHRLDFAFRTYLPQIVFHAAAYKHVPLMEENPCEAILTNVAGTRNVADMCIRYNIEKMVMISTDKAVNPTNIMGCTKRLAEIYVQSLGQAIAAGAVERRTKFVTTRFGNVLGSNGSVIPRFREQIANGGPVTVTHPDITRFFMTIPEACRLVMEAATMSDGNEIFVFDMGKSVKIAHLAKRMIELAGFTPGVDIQIEYTGLRPGEKLYEEVLSNKENTLPTAHEKIRVAQVREYDYQTARLVVDNLEKLARAVDIPNTVRMMKRTVPEFKSKNSLFEKYDHEQDESDIDRVAQLI